MTKDEALRLALEAMKVSNGAWKSLADSGDAGFWKAEKQGYYQLNEQAIIAVEAALEAKNGCQCPACKVVPHASDCAVHNEPAYQAGKCNCGASGEPVALPSTASDISDFIGSSYVWREHKISDVEPREDDKYCVTAHDLLEAFARLNESTIPPQRKPLTDDEVLRLLSKIDEYAVRLPRGLRDFARAIEAAHGIKGEYETTN